MTELDQLRGMIGAQGVRRILECALPYLEQNRQQLLQQLQAGEWETAAATAHRIKGTAHLYGSESLLACLNKIITDDLNLDASGTLIAQTDQQVTFAIIKLKQLLSSS